ncbi:MAG: methionyl-tRNA formyltransferase [Bacteroides sp.]|nr:MAG: methionyl-tRNA formyltransferase [Bacteroides sp.]
MNIVFMCNSDFAIPSLDILYKQQYNIVGLLTKKNSKFNTKNSFYRIIKKYCDDKNINFITYEYLNFNYSLINQLKHLRPDIFIVISFEILPSIIFQIPKKGSINLHPSLLPKYRGAAPINWAIINGEKNTGLTTFFINNKIDQGDIISQINIEISKYDNYSTLYEKLKYLGANLIVKSINKIYHDNFKGIQQSFCKKNDINFIAPKIFPKDCWINWNSNCKNIIHFINGLSMYPGARTIFENTIMKIFKADYNIVKHYIKPGTINTDYKNFIKIASLDGYINIVELQISGRKKMNIKNFIIGYYKNR